VTVPVTSVPEAPGIDTKEAAMETTGHWRHWRHWGRWRHWGWALLETAGVTAAFLGLGLGYGALVRRAPAEPTGYVAGRTVAPEESLAHVAAWNGGRRAVGPADGRRVP